MSSRTANIIRDVHQGSTSRSGAPRSPSPALSWSTPFARRRLPDRHGRVSARQRGDRRRARHWIAAANSPLPIQAGASVAARCRKGDGVVALGYDGSHVLECKRWLAERKQKDDAFAAPRHPTWRRSSSSRRRETSQSLAAPMQKGVSAFCPS